MADRQKRLVLRLLQTQGCAERIVSDMYYAGKKKEDIKPKPFSVRCGNCGSHNVSVTAYEYRDLGITCHSCGAFLGCGSYNETEYYGEEDE